MKKADYWKNFQLGKEIDIAGSFLYNGLSKLHSMESLYYESEIFMVLYDLAVGLERTLKVAVILLEHDEFSDQESLEESLITHTHQHLLSRVKKLHPLKLSNVHHEFVDLLGAFYKSHRYGRCMLM